MALAAVGIKVIPRIAYATIRDGAGGEVAGNFGAGGVEGVYNALAVNAHGNRLANHLVVERGEGVGHADVEDVQSRAIGNLKVGVGFDNGEIFGTEVVNAIHGAGLQFEQAGSGFCRPAHDEGLSGGCFAPIVGVGNEGDAFAAFPFADHVGTSADGLLKSFAGAGGFASGCFKPFGGIDGEGAESDLGEEGGIGRQSVKVTVESSVATTDWIQPM